MMEINNSFDVQKRRLLSTFGSSHKDISLPQKEYKDSRKFNIKESKIIEENLEETYIQSPLMKSPRCISINTRQSIVSPGE